MDPRDLIRVGEVLQGALGRKDWSAAVACSSEAEWPDRYEEPFYRGVRRRAFFSDFPAPESHLARELEPTFLLVVEFVWKVVGDALVELEEGTRSFDRLHRYRYAVTHPAGCDPLAWINRQDAEPFSPLWCCDILGLDYEMFTDFIRATCLNKEGKRPRDLRLERSARKASMQRQREIEMRALENLLDSLRRGE
jgi:hypothetical protein